jgi:hypothetical protein
MVGPVSQSERDSFTRKFQFGVAGLVAASTGLVALGAGASLRQTSVALLGGVVVGSLVAWYAVPTTPAPAERQRSEQKNPFADEDDAGESEAESGRSPSAARRRRK